MFDSSIATITTMAGILTVTVAGVTLPEPPADGNRAIVSAVESDSLANLHGSEGATVTIQTEQGDTEQPIPEPNEAPASPLIPAVTVLGHYPGYAAQRLRVDSIRYDMFTHVSYFSLWPLANGDLDVSEVNVADLQELAAHADAAGIKALVTIGGWGRSTYFPAMAASPRARDNFAMKLLQYCLDYNLKGVDLDWEPVSTVSDRTNYSLLIERLHEEFEPFGLTLSMSVSAYGHEIRPEAIHFVETLNVMAYDATPPHHSTFDFAVSALDHWEDYGAPREKLMLGLPFYGKSADGTGYAYRDIRDMYHPAPDTDFVGGIGFNGITTIKNKTTYVVRNGYRGIMIWEIAQDTTDGSSLLTAAADAIANSLGANPDPNMLTDVNDPQGLGSASDPGLQINQWSNNDEP